MTVWLRCWRPVWQSVYPDRVGFDAKRQILVLVTRLDSGPEQPAQLHASWRVLDDNNRLLDSGRIQLNERHDVSVASQIAAQSLLVQRLGDELTRAVEKLSSR